MDILTSGISIVNLKKSLKLFFSASTPLCACPLLQTVSTALPPWRQAGASSPPHTAPCPTSVHLHLQSRGLWKQMCSRYVESSPSAPRALFMYRSCLHPSWGNPSVRIFSMRCREPRVSHGTSSFVSETARALWVYLYCAAVTLAQKKKNINCVTGCMQWWLWRACHCAEAEQVTARHVRDVWQCFKSTLLS